MNCKIAVISDIHSNADALDWALYKIRSESVDLTVVLGDLFTYCCQPKATINTLNNYIENNETVFIKGNHDQFYFDIANNKNPFTYNVPEFVRESIDWTCNELKNIDLEGLYKWNNNYSLDYLFFAHANPYEYGNWEYVDKEDQYLKASNELSCMSKRVGIFGHSHRSRIISVKANAVNKIDNFNRINLGYSGNIILNPGAIGHPRGDNLHFMIISKNRDYIRVIKYKILVNLDNTKKLIANSSMSQSTKRRILDYFK